MSERKMRFDIFSDIAFEVLSFIYPFCLRGSSGGWADNETGFALVCKEWNIAWHLFFPDISLLPPRFLFLSPQDIPCEEQFNSLRQVMDSTLPSVDAQHNRKVLPKRQQLLSMSCSRAYFLCYSLATTKQPVGYTVEGVYDYALQLLHEVTERHEAMPVSSSALNVLSLIKSTYVRILFICNTFQYLDTYYVKYVDKVPVKTKGDICLAQVLLSTYRKKYPALSTDMLIDTIDREVGALWSAQSAESTGYDATKYITATAICACSAQLQLMKSHTLLPASCSVKPCTLTKKCLASLPAYSFVQTTSMQLHLKHFEDITLPMQHPLVRKSSLLSSFANALPFAPLPTGASLVLFMDCVPSWCIHKMMQFAEHFEHLQFAQILKPLPSVHMHENTDAWSADFIDAFETSQVLEILMAANFLGFTNVVDLASAWVASKMKGKTPEEIRDFF